MRYQGQITDWKDDRGFGFITPNGGTDQVFVHISAFGQRQQRPDINELVTYELVTGTKKGARAEEVLYVVPRDAVSHDIHEQAGQFERSERSEQTPFFRQFIVVVIVVAVGLYGWERYQLKPSRGGSNFGRLLAIQPAASTASIPNLGAVEKVSTIEDESRTAFQCRGKRSCPEMTSCAEAIFYLRNCTGTELDGDGDGIPCESQWCGG
jgi:cold shock CspA family protein